MNCTVIIPAAGRGTRFGGDVPKQYATLHGQPILALTIERFLRTGLARRVIVATSEDDDRWNPLRESRGWEDVVRATGGETRQESVLSALRIAGNQGLVAIHDAVRPYFRTDTLRRLLETAEETGAAIPALSVRETIHVVREARIVETPDRSELWAAQTPQCFRVELLTALIERAWHEGFTATDEASLFVRYDQPVRVVEGDIGNVKITTSEDLVLMERILENEKS
jgi:2-C-methyl-D-erythritol 4-phosphate cytidylyltransferase